MSLLAELQRRNVTRVAIAYVAVAWVVVQVVETLFPIFDLSDRAVRIVVIVLAIGFVPAVIGAWVFEWTPEGLKRDADAGTADRFRGSRNLDRAIVVILAIGIVYFAFDKFVLAPEREAEIVEQARIEAKAEAVTGFYGDRSIAVLPFDNLSADPEQVHFVDGVAEEVLNLLAGIRDLRVISRSSSFAFRGENLDIPEIAEQLNVAHVLEGSVRRAGNRVRVTAQLIEARTDTHLWSKTYERELGDVFRIQDEIAADVVRNLELELNSDLPRSRHVDPEVLALTAQANQLFQARPQGLAEKMHPLLSRALEIDPDHVPALSLMVVVVWLENAGLPERREKMDREIDALFDRILEIDPRSAHRDFYRAFNLSGENRLEEAAALYLSGLDKDLTDPDNVRLAGFFAQHIGKFDAAVRLLKYALAVDPLCHQCRRRFAENLMFAGEYERAKREYERYLTVAAEGREDYVLLLLLMGKPDDALAYLDGLSPVDEFERHTLHARRAMALHSLGRPDEADSVFAALSDSDFHDQRYLKLLLTQVAAWRGDNDLAFENLYAMAATGFQLLHRSTFSPIWRNLHDDPRWAEYLEFNRLSPERLDAIDFDPALPE